MSQSWIWPKVNQFYASCIESMATIQDDLCLSPSNSCSWFSISRSNQNIQAEAAMNQVALLLLNKKWIWMWKRKKLQREFREFGNWNENPMEHFTLQTVSAHTHLPIRNKQNIVLPKPPLPFLFTGANVMNLGDVFDFGRLFVSLSLLQKSQPNVSCELWLDPIPSSQYIFPPSDFSPVAKRWPWWSEFGWRTNSHGRRRRRMDDVKKRMKKKGVGLRENAWHERVFSFNDPSGKVSQRAAHLHSSVMYSKL
jgi:hypothetical protein